MRFDQVWAQDVVAVCGPVFAATGLDFSHQTREEPSTGVTALLWEAGPQEFAARYPDSGIVESYGDQWPDVACIDFWAYVDGGTSTFSTSTEGWSSLVDAQDEPLTGDGARDGRAIGAVFARILGVEPPA